MSAGYKGLGAPVGAVLAGGASLIEQAWRYKQMWGGALRQSGMLAAAAL
ncbi:beta-eliminating lyase-related protein [Nonomuraea spiralis]